METNREKFNKIATTINTNILEEIQFRNANREWMRRSNRIATKILIALKEQNLSQKTLANRMGVTPQYISKLVKGKENFTLETCTKLEAFLGIEIYHDSIKEKKSIEYADYTSSYQKKYDTLTPFFYSNAI